VQGVGFRYWVRSRAQDLGLRGSAMNLLDGRVSVGHCCVGSLRGRDTEKVIDACSLSTPPTSYRFPREVIAVAVRWYLRYGLSFRDVEELLAEGGIRVDHVTIYRWVQTFTAVFIDAARRGGMSR
jgi:acylphosphatase